MNYKKIYFNIIRNRQNNPLPLDVYGENHHIIPRSFGGNDNPKNLVRLSAREHFIVHLLLVDILPPPNLAVMVGESLRPVVTSI